MKAIWEVETLQISVTSACVLECANCTHLVGHARRPHMMTLDQFKKTVDSLEGYPKMIGLIGGERRCYRECERERRTARCGKCCGIDAMRTAA